MVASLWHVSGSCAKLHILLLVVNLIVPRTEQLIHPSFCHRTTRLSKFGLQMWLRYWKENRIEPPWKWGKWSPVSAWRLWYLGLLYMERREQRLRHGTSGTGSINVSGMRKFSAYTYKVNKIDHTQDKAIWVNSIILQTIDCHAKKYCFWHFLPKNSSSKSLYGRVCKAEELKTLGPGLCFRFQVGVSDGFPKLPHW